MSKRTRDLLEVFPIRRIENDFLISIHGDYSACFEVLLPEIFSLSAKVEMIGTHRMESGDFRDMNEIWGKAINVMPINTIIHKQDIFTVDTYKPRYEVKDSFDKASERHFNERPFLTHRSLLYITKTHPNRQNLSSISTTLVSGRLIPRDIGDPRQQEEFMDALAQFVSILTSTKKVGLRRIKADELFNKEGRPGILERYMSLDFTGENVPLCDTQMDGDIYVGNKLVKFFSIADVDDLPDTVYTHNRKESLSSEHSTINVSFAAPVSMMLNVDHIYNQYIFKMDKNVAFPKLQQRSQQMRAMSTFSKANEVNARLIDQYLDTTAETGYVPVQCHFNVMVWTEDKTRLPQIRNQVNSAISLMGVRPRENGTDAALLFWAGIPGAAADLPVEDRFWTLLPQACCLLNQESNTEGDLSTFGVKVVERLSGRPLLVDFSDVPMEERWVTNRNKFVLGGSGSGKSFLTNHFAKTYLSGGTHMVIVDVGDSYEGLCQMLGGKYLTYQEDNPIRFNPFYIESRKRPNTEKKQAIKALILSLWKKEEEAMTRLEETAISLAVTGYFDSLQENMAVRPCFNTFYEFLQGDFKQMLQTKGVSTNHFDYQAFMITMEPFYEGGEYDYLLNSEDSMDLLQVPFIVFELDNIKDHPILFPVVTIIIMDTFITKMRQLPKTTRKIILIEEAWKAIMKQEMAEFIKYLYKTVRKYFGEAWIVTQEVDDIINSTVVR
ncbi:MAG: TraG family conjugative transposon ATPase, partial [Rudanella sp.]|nr:TraG family conjugative transposon ATPase [Rudanella sp.]